MSQSSFPFIRYQPDQWTGWVHKDWAQTLANSDPLTWMATQPHEQCRYRESRQIYRVSTPKGVVYLKLMLGLNEQSMQHNSPWLDRMKWRFRPSRAVQTLLVSHVMLTSDLWCPPPILAARQSVAGGSRDVFISQAVELPGLGVLLGQTNDQSRCISMVRELAPHIVRLHQQRFLHGDLLPNNLHVTDDLKHVCFMDNDRTRRWPCKLPYWTIRRNLAQLAYRMLYHQGQEVTMAFLQAYGETSKWTRKQQSQRTAYILQVARKRIDNHREEHAQTPPAQAASSPAENPHSNKTDSL